MTRGNLRDIARMQGGLVEILGAFDILTISLIVRQTLYLFSEINCINKYIFYINKIDGHLAQ